MAPQRAVRCFSSHRIPRSTIARHCTPFPAGCGQLAPSVQLRAPGVHLFLRTERIAGLDRGVDVLDALVLVGQHGVYCQSARQPGKPAMDVQMILAGIEDAKELVGSVMLELKRRRDAARDSAGSS